MVTACQRVRSISSSPALSSFVDSRHQSAPLLSRDKLQAHSHGFEDDEQDSINEVPLGGLWQNRIFASGEKVDRFNQSSINIQLLSLPPFDHFLTLFRCHESRSGLERGLNCDSLLMLTTASVEKQTIDHICPRRAIVVKYVGNSRTEDIWMSGTRKPQVTVLSCLGQLQFIASCLLFQPIV